MSSRESPAAMQSSRRIAADLHVAGDAAGLGRSARDQVVGVDHGHAGHLLRCRADDPVVDEPQPPETLALQQGGHLVEVHVAAEQVRHLAPA